MKVRTTFEKEYEYKPRLSLFLLAGIGLAVMVAGTFHMASTNDRGLIINGIIELGVQGATRVYWVMMGILATGMLVLIVGVIRHLRGTRRIAFAQDFIIVPKSHWSFDEQAVRYGDIQDIVLEDNYGQKGLVAKHPKGKFTIAASMLPNKAVFEEVVQLLLERVDAVYER